DGHMVDVNTGRVAARAFRDVRWNRDRGAAQLSGQPVSLVDREPFRLGVTALNQRHSELPNFEIPIRLNGVHERPDRTGCAVSNCQTMLEWTLRSLHFLRHVPDPSTHFLRSRIHQSPAT